MCFDAWIAWTWKNSMNGICRYRQCAVWLQTFVLISDVDVSCLLPIFQFILSIDTQSIGMSSEILRSIFLILPAVVAYDISLRFSLRIVWRQVLDPPRRRYASQIEAFEVMLQTIVLTFLALISISIRFTTQHWLPYVSKASKWGLALLALDIVLHTASIEVAKRSKKREACERCQDMKFKASWWFHFDLSKHVEN